VDGNGWTPAGELKAGDHLLTVNKTKLPVENVLETGDTETVYNFRVADWHTYFVGKKDWDFEVWVHNACKVPGSNGPGQNNIPSLDDLSSLGNIPAKGDLTKAGHSLSKHGSGKRPGSTSFPNPNGNPAQINQQAKDLLDDILTDPAGIIRQRPGRPGDQLIQISKPDGSGVIYKWDGIQWVFSHFGENLF
jgi:hypothetical protein